MGEQVNAHPTKPLREWLDQAVEVVAAREATLQVKAAAVLASLVKAQMGQPTAAVAVVAVPVEPRLLELMAVAVALSLHGAPREQVARAS